MARARNIKPSFFNNDELADIDPLGRLLFIGMWTIADFKGCFEYKPKRLKVQVLPYDNCDIEQLTINLDKSGFISIYSVLGQQYVKVLNFDKHQNPHKNERDKGSEIPDIFDRDDIDLNKSIIINELQNIENNRDKNGTTHDKNESDRADSLNLIPSTLIPDSLIPVCQETPHTQNSEDSISWSPNKNSLEAILKTTKHSQKSSEILGMDDFEFHLGNFNTHHEKNFQLTDNQKLRKFAQWLIQEFEKLLSRAEREAKFKNKGTDNFHDSFYGVGQSPFGKQENNQMRDVGDTPLLNYEDTRF